MKGREQLMPSESAKMEILDYRTAGGKNVIFEYINSLPKKERAEGIRIRHTIRRKGLVAFDELDTRQLKGKLWEIKFYDNRIMYVLFDGNSVYFLHACQKQKNKAEKFELEKAIKRAKEAGLKID